MVKRMMAAVALLVTLLIPGMALAQAQAPAPPPEALATARELITASRAVDNFKLLLPSLVQQIKPVIVQGRPQVEKDFDALVPALLESIKARLGDLIEAVAVIYATNFTVAEMKELIAFYRTPIGQKLLEKGPVIAQQSMVVGQKFGAELGGELQSRMIRELKKKGHNI
jgi:hypothetical protein